MRKNCYLVVILILVIMIIFSSVSVVYAKEGGSEEEIKQELEEKIDEQLDSIDWDSLEEFLETHAEDDYGLFDGSLFQTAKNILNGNFFSDSSTFLQYLFDVFFDRLKETFPLLSEVLVICIFSGIVGKTKSNLLNEGTGRLINFFFFSTVLLLLLSGILELLEIARESIYSVKSLSNMTMPILLTLMTATGAKVSSKVYTPAIALLSEGVTEVVSGIVLPMFVFCIVFCIVSNLSHEIKLHQLSKFFKNVSSWILGITFTVFTGLLAIQGLTAATIDGVSIRAAKFATKTYIPILGGYLADGFDLILTSCILIKNSFGVIVLLMILSVVLTPILHITVFNCGLRLVSAVSEPIADNSIVSFLVEVSKSLSILLVSVMAVTFMLFILVMMIIFSANIY